jgi:hypothetical protein
MQVDVSPEAAGLVRERGGRLWVWAARPRVCCWGTPAYMHAATTPPPRLSGFSLVPHDGIEIWFRAPPGGFLTCWRSACGEGAGLGSRRTGTAA